MSAPLLSTAPLFPMTGQPPAAPKTRSGAAIAIVVVLVVVLVVGVGATVWRSQPGAAAASNGRIVAITDPEKRADAIEWQSMLNRSKRPTVRAALAAAVEAAIAAPSGGAVPPGTPTGSPIDAPVIPTNDPNFVVA